MGNNLMRLSLCLWGLVLAQAARCQAPFPGKQSEWQGFSRYDFELAERNVTIVAIERRHNPIDILEPIAKAHVPIVHVAGDADDPVPIDEMLLKQRYEAFGGHVELIVKHGVGHHPHSLADPSPIVDYILKNRLKENN